MQVKDKILVIEDERSIRSFIGAILNANGYEVLYAQNGKNALTMVASHCPNLMILDLGLPDMDGLEIIRRVREWSHLPILVVSARSYEQDKVSALDLGADDYITKPFGTDELLARIRTALRHTHSQSIPSDVAQTGKFRAGGMVIDYDKHHVYIDGENVHLTQNEYRIVALLGRYAGKVLTYDYLLRELWGPAAHGNNQILRVNMANIRRKIEKNPAEPAYIFTEVGVGYRMIDGSEQQNG